MQIIPASYCAGMMGGLQPFDDSYFDTLFEMFSTCALELLRSSYRQPYQFTDNCTCGMQYTLSSEEEKHMNFRKQILTLGVLD